ncbi:type VI secretion system accessory protein TagJ [Roseomonas xinghualingensis]|uniref:type VI secretion system accessory protein TagJ n=1 Tax=Roseomonas xinghualingensis TaxID=2986475 RepID=UPI0021F0B99B|nr:type VI secretion system accessory protein TagJ [Roseomonas sp. SXEYE001]MCV4209669.1 tetratricopeptide repeat protein [Roseomonas sp. SXEYE001]
MSPTKEVSAGSLFREGRLADAITAANDAVRKAPADATPRVLLAELLVFAGNLERADVVLDACGDIDPGLAMVVAEFRQILRGELARRQVFRDGRVPDFLFDPTPTQRSALAALTAQRAGDLLEAGRLAAEAETARVHPKGKAADMAFDDLRDGDDLLSGCFEVITTTGKYFWVPPERVVSIIFHPPKRPRDLYWRRASMQVAAGPDGDVYIPAIYPAPSDADLTEELRLGRATGWHQPAEAGPVRGLGAVTMLIGEESRTVMELDNLCFEPQE